MKGGEGGRDGEVVAVVVVVVVAVTPSDNGDPRTMAHFLLRCVRMTKQKVLTKKLPR